jgi:hypothetical protein
MFWRSRAGQRVAALSPMPRFFLRFASIALVFGAVSFPVPALAVTVDEIVGLARAGVSDAVILALIGRDKSILSVGPNEIVNLRRQGVSETVIVAMMNSGRAEGEEAARVAAADTAAFIRSGLTTEPDLVIVGHGPERPNTSHPDGFYSAPGTGPYYVLPYVVGGGGHRRGRTAVPAPSPDPSVTPPAGFVAPWNAALSPFRVPVIAPVGIR